MLDTAHTLLFIYLQTKSTIFERVRLTTSEEQDVKRHCSIYSSSDPWKCYNSHYRDFFPIHEMLTTGFFRLLQDYLPLFKFVYDSKGINFSGGIKEILIDRFRLEHFITLYNLAKASSVSLEKYCYLLHHLLIRAKINYQTFPAVLVKMLGRALLLVAEKPGYFRTAPSWFIGGMSVDLNDRRLSESRVISCLPPFTWTRPANVNDEENERAKKIAAKEDENENSRIWSLLARYDLDQKGAPSWLPENPSCFTLRYECYMVFSKSSKQFLVRALYLQIASNYFMYQFFVSVLNQCDQLKQFSKMGWNVAPFIEKSVSVTYPAVEEHVSPIPEPVSLVNYASPEQPLVDLCKYFVKVPQPADKSDFLFESQLEQPNGYQHQFYSELKNSWLAYTNETKFSYSWLSTQSAYELESVLRTKYHELHQQAEQSWNEIASLFDKRYSIMFNEYFGLRWYSGRVWHHDKGDILRLLIEPHKLSSYNPDCLPKRGFIIKQLLHYISLEIKLAQIVRVLALIEQRKHMQNEAEQFSLLQGLVKSLQENLDPKSYQYPHWFLFQFENDIIVRDNQRELIVEMLSQTEKAMYQLNMGEGKSSVILPLLSYNLANGKQLLRVNVLSALLTTMKDFLQQRFSGLIRKHIYTLPFNRDTDISTHSLKLIFETLQKCCRFGHVLLVTPEHRLCLQLKIRELMLENQLQKGATNIFNWDTYRERVQGNMEVYQDLDEQKTKELLLEQDQCLRTCLRDEKYLNADNHILKVPPRGQGRTDFARFKSKINNSKFREWSCLKAAYRELFHNSKLAYNDCTEKLSLLNKIGAVAAIDLLDESDEILRHGTELNYTMGDKCIFAGGELRWQIPQFFIQSIFCDAQLRDVISAGKGDGFTTINLHFSSQGGVPFIQLLNESFYEERIKPILIDKFFEEHLSSLRKYYFTKDTPLVQGKRSSLKHYVAGQLPLQTEKEIMGLLADKGTLKDKLLIAKGWLSHGILFHVFNSKYRVRYGLNLEALAEFRKQIAIPFFGKDAPSPRSEFSHPDVILGFTIISYLYQGLDQMQLKKTLNRLKAKFSLEVADSYLSAWIKAGQAWIETQTDKFPPTILTSLQLMDLEDELCLHQVHLYLSRNYMAIFFYLNQFVLLEEAMQYLYKISANAHSLVGYDAALGFSGTDDRKITMPHKIKSCRSVTQEGTNGKLLSVLTQERNSNYYSLTTEDTESLLEKLCEFAGKHPHCHALIDAGALVTGLSNYAVAEFLLAHLPCRFQGILYFGDESNCLTVLTQDKKTTPLQDFFIDKQYIFAYLDDIHTRGTDIKLPLNCHAILTIGMGMQKDKLMQAAMRLRQLAQKQSVSLWGTQAVTLAISRDNSVDLASINSFEVIKWATRNTIDHINADLFPVAVRKINFQFLRRAEVWLKEAPTTMETLIQCCQDKELYLLEDFYALTPQVEDLADRLSALISTRFKAFWQDLRHECERKYLIGFLFYEKVTNRTDKEAWRQLLTNIFEEVMPYLQSGCVHNSLDNDEEKEVEVEIIEEQQVENKVERRKECSEKEWDPRLILRPDFVRIAEQQSIIMPLTGIEDFIQIPPNLKNIIWHSDIYMTNNFIQTVQSSPKEALDNYLRLVDLVLMHRSFDRSTAVLLSGHEASQIKLTCYHQLQFNSLIHISDIDGPSQLPKGILVSKQENKLLTIVKLFSGKCHYPTLKEVFRVAKRLGRLYPLYFTCPIVSEDVSSRLFNMLAHEEYLDFAGVMTEKLLKVLRRGKSGESSLDVPDEYQPYSHFLHRKLHGVFSKLIFVPSGSLRDNHNILSQWVGTRGRLREYPGSALESIINLEYEPKVCSQT